MNWMHINAPTTVFYPGKDMSSEAGSRTTTAADSQTLNAALVNIKSVQVGSGHLTGTLLFETHGGQDVRTLATPTASTANMAVNYTDLEFTVPGGFRVSAPTGSATCSLYIQYEYAEIFRN